MKSRLLASFMKFLEINEGLLLRSYGSPGTTRLLCPSGKSLRRQEAVDIKQNPIRRPIVSIVDDDLSIRQSLKMLFESADFEAEIFASAEEFLSAGNLAESACLVLDIQLPGISGIDLQNRLRADGNDVAVIFITAHHDEHTRQLAMSGGATRFFAKPFSGNDLLIAVRTSQ
jgi:FixJ family two-component response regulator